MRSVLNSVLHSDKSHLAYLVDNETVDSKSMLSYNSNDKQVFSWLKRQLKLNSSDFLIANFQGYDSCLHLRSARSSLPCEKQLREINGYLKAIVDTLQDNTLLLIASELASNVSYSTLFLDCALSFQRFRCRIATPLLGRLPLSQQAAITNRDH